jgi:predicted nuclease of predicted toxin-antitoxin system
VTRWKHGGRIGRERAGVYSGATIGCTGVDVVRVRDRGLLRATDRAVFARAPDEDRILVTSDVDDLTKLAAAATVHAGLVFFEDGGFLRADQLRLVREALALVRAVRAAGCDLVNRVLRFWSNSAHVSNASV